MSKPPSTTVTGREADGEKKAARPDTADTATAGADSAAQRVRAPVRSGKAAATPNKGRPSKVNKGNRSSRTVREQGANAKSEGTEEEEEEEEEAASGADPFWQYIVTASYRSRKARLDWGGEGEG